jgi:putative transposase
VCIRLQVTPEQDTILAATLSASRECFNAVAALGWERREKNGVSICRLPGTAHGGARRSPRLSMRS